MKKIAIADAKDAALDWLVWKALGGVDSYPETASGKSFFKLWRGNSRKYVHPTTEWEHGGPLVSLLMPRGLKFQAVTDKVGSFCVASLDKPHGFFYGPTPLMAICRCFVAAELGTEVEVPEELL